MSTPFFTESKCSALRIAAESWQGTPFAPGGTAIKGARGGACCHRLVAAVLAEAGWLDYQDLLPDAPLNWATHHRGSLMADFMRERPHHFQERPLSPLNPAPGDILVMRLGIGAHHLALVIDRGEIIHTWQGAGALIVPLGQPRWYKRIHSIFTPLDYV